MAASFSLVKYYGFIIPRIYGGLWSFIRVASPQVPPTTSEQDREERSRLVAAERGQTWPSLAWVGANTSQLGPQLAPNSGQSASAWAQIGVQRGATWARLSAPNLSPSCAMWDPTCARVGAQWSCWAEDAPKSIQMVSRLKPCDAHVGPSHVQHGVTWDLLATASHQVGPNGDTICGTLLGTKCHRYEKTRKIPVKTRVLTILYWAGNVPRVEPMWSWIWAEVAPTWVQLVAKLRWTKLGRSWSQVSPSRTPGSARVTAEHGPPTAAEAVPVNRGLFESIGSAPKVRADFS